MRNIPCDSIKPESDELREYSQHVTLESVSSAWQSIPLKSVKSPFHPRRESESADEFGADLSLAEPRDQLSLAAMSIALNRLRHQ